ncbi:MAG: hypothetical protein K2X38_17990 [Gemmataceae bacterium]|nr:hypothetical protein [Gemmataceae bacterium]
MNDDQKIDGPKTEAARREREKVLTRRALLGAGFALPLALMAGAVAKVSAKDQDALLGHRDHYDHTDRGYHADYIVHQDQH